MPAYRYWGLRVVARSVSSTLYAVLAEVDFRATIGGADLCSGGTPGAASSDAPDVAARAFDNDFATYWQRSGTGTVLIWYDFGSPVTVAEAWFRLPGAATARPGSVYGPEGVQIVGSDDGTTWRDLVSYVLPTIADAAEYTVAVPSTYEYLLHGEVFTLDTGVTNASVLTGESYSYDAADSGPYRVAGTVVIDGTPATPASRRVRLFDKLSGRLVREQWSAADGAFEFAQVRVGPWLLVVDDYTLTYEADAATEVLAVL